MRRVATRLVVDRRVPVEDRYLYKRHKSGGLQIRAGGWRAAYQALKRRWFREETLRRVGHKWPKVPKPSRGDRRRAKAREVSRSRTVRRLRETPFERLIKALKSQV